MWSFDNLDSTGLIYIKMFPCSLEIFSQISFLSCFADSLVSANNFTCSLLHWCFVHDKFTWWMWFLTISSIICFNGIGIEHRSHEKIIIIILESFWKFSFISVWSNSSTFRCMPVLGLDHFSIILFFICDLTFDSPEDNSIRAANECGNCCEFHIYFYV